MKIKRDYLSASKRFFVWFLSRFKPLTVHTEAIMIDSVWEEIKKEVKRKRVRVWYIMTPTNIDYFRANFNVRISKVELSKIMKERYKWMINHKQKLELHIHFSQIIETLSYEKQEKLFIEAISWMKKEIGLTPKEFVPGWWAYDKNTLRLCKKYNLKMIYERDYDFTHDYFPLLSRIKTTP